MPTASAASTTVAGVVELATDAEAAAASATDKALTASNISSIDTSDLNNDAGFITDLIGDTSPQLGGNLDVLARIIETSTSNGTIGLEPDGTGHVAARGTGSTPGTIALNCEQNSHAIKLQSPAHGTYSDYTLKLPTGVGSNGQALTTDGSNPAQLAWTTISGGGGGSRPVVRSVSSDTTIGADVTIQSTELERVYIVDTSSAVNMTLPQITGDVGNGYKLNIKRDGSNNCTITPNSVDNIDGGTDGAAITLSVDKSSFTLVCDGTNWQII